MSAAGVVSRIFIQRRKTAPELIAVVLMPADLPVRKKNQIDFYYWYYGSLALFQQGGPDGPLWKQWSSALVDALLPNQKSRDDGCERGAWDPSVERWGFEGGRVYATATNALTLETPYRYPVVAGSQWRPR